MRNRFTLRELVENLRNKRQQDFTSEYEQPTQTSKEMQVQAIAEFKWEVRKNKTI
jgi:hypothetical protein